MFAIHHMNRKLGIKAVCRPDYHYEIFKFLTPFGMYFRQFSDGDAPGAI